MLNLIAEAPKSARTSCRVRFCNSMAPSVAPKAHRALHRICSAKKALQYLISGEYHGIGANFLSVSKEVMWVCVCVWVCGCVHVLALVMHWTWWHAGMLSCILFYFPLLQWLEVIIDAFCTNAKELMRCFWTRPCLDVSSVAMSDSSWQRPQTWRRTSSLGSRNVCVCVGVSSYLWFDMIFEYVLDMREAYSLQQTIAASGNGTDWWQSMAHDWLPSRPSKPSTDQAQQPLLVQLDCLASNATKSCEGTQKIAKASNYIEVLVGVFLKECAAVWPRGKAALKCFEHVWVIVSVMRIQQIRAAYSSLLHDGSSHTAGLRKSLDPEGDGSEIIGWYENLKESGHQSAVGHLPMRANMTWTCTIM